jgi:hypothetical protein
MADRSFLATGEWPCIENDTTKTNLEKLVLSSSEAFELRRLLFSESISKAHLMPSLDNVRSTLNTGINLLF